MYFDFIFGSFNHILEASLAASAPSEGEEGLGSQEGSTQLATGERELLKQDFLLHPSISVSQLLEVRVLNGGSLRARKAFL